MFNTVAKMMKEYWSGPRDVRAPIARPIFSPPSTLTTSIQTVNPSLTAIGFNDFLALDIAPREMLLHPILPERSLSMLYAPRGVGKSWLGLSIGLAVASGRELLRWSAPNSKRVLYVDGEMPLVSLQERLRAISLCL